MNESIANKLQTIAKNQQKVFDSGYITGNSAGYTEGYQEGYDVGNGVGYTEGRQEEYDHFWDVFQENGKRTVYSNAFIGFRKTGNFYPKYDIVPTGGAAAMMQYFGIGETEPIDLAERLEECGVRLDTSKATSLQQAFYWRLGVSRLPTISVESATNTQNAIANNMHLVTIDKIIFSNDGTQPSHDSVLGSNPNLQNVTVEGVIGKSLNLGGTYRLSADSMKSIILHLKDYAGTDGEFANKLTMAADPWARLERSGTAPDGGTWRNYVNNLGWNT